MNKDIISEKGNRGHATVNFFSWSKKWHDIAGNYPLISASDATIPAGEVLTSMLSVQPLFSTYLINEV